MADEIVNKLGFDVSQALDALTKLDQALQGSATSFGSLGSAMQTWNSQASATITILKDIASNASAAAAAMSRLNSAYARSGNISPASPAAQPTPATAQKPQLWLPPGVTSTAQQAQQAIANIGTTAQAVGQQVNGATANATANTLAATTATNKWVVSWETLARVVATQFIVRMLSQVRDYLDDAYNGAMQFQTALAEIRTIVPAIDNDIRGLGQEVADISKRFNFPLPETAEAVYNTISDQFVTVGERTSVMSAAAKLAKVSVTELDDSVSLLTGTLNAYGMAASQSENVAAKFFQAINIGRMRGSELVPVIGRLVPIAAEAGVSLDELNSAMVALTIGGMKVPEAATGLRAGIAAFLKPSEDMKRTLREMGYESGEQLIRAKGLQGAFLAMADAANEETSEIAKLFRNIRALNAELRLTGTGAEKAAQAMKVMETTSADTLNRVFEEFRSVDSERLSSELNKLNVELTTQLGNTLIRLLLGFTEVVGGSENLVAALRALLVAAVPVTVALGAIAASLMLVSLNAKLAATNAVWVGTAFTQLLLPIAAVAAALTFLDAKLTQALAAPREAAERRLQEMVEAQQQRVEKELEEERKKNQKMMSLFEENSASMRRAYFQAIDDIRDKNSELVNNAKTTTDAMISSQEKIVTALRNAAQQANQLVTASISRRADLEAKYSDTVFKYAQKNTDAYSKADAYRRRSLLLAKQAQDALSRAKSPEEVQSAISAFQRAQAHAQEADSIAESTGNILLQGDAERAVLAVTRMQMDAEVRLQQLQAQRADQAAKEAAANQARVDNMKALTKEILEGMNLFEKGGPKDAKVRQRQEATLRENMQRLQDLWLQGQQLDISDIVSFDSLQRRLDTILEGGVSQAEVNRLFASSDTLADFNRQLTDGIGPVQVQVAEAGRYDPDLRGRLRGKTTDEQQAVLSQELQKAVQRSEALKRQLSEADLAVTNMNGSAELLSATMSSWEFAHEPRGTGLLAGLQTIQRAISALANGQSISKLNADFDSLWKRMQQFAENPALLTLERFTELQKDTNALLEGGGLTGTDRDTLSAMLKQAKAITDFNQRRQDLGSQRQEMEAELILLQQRMQDILNSQQKAQDGTSQLQSSTDQASTNAGTMASQLANVSNLDMSGLVSQISQAAVAMEALATASANVQMPGGAVTAANGGVIRYLAGGGPVGTDTIPAMLSPDEFVMNAPNSRKFRSQLIAMNAGVQPVFRSDGGSVTTTIGDINVTVNGGSTGRQTGRDIAAELRRELRRGTSRL